jgi:hypothetical protein
VKRISKQFALGVTLAMVVGVLALTTQSAPAAPVAYTTLDTDGCQLATIDLATGTVTPLPDAPSSNNCVDDLAVGADGTVWGIKDLPVKSNQRAGIVKFDPTTGDAVDTQLFDNGNFDFSFTAHGGIAIDASGVMYVSFTSNEDGCSDFQGNDAEACLYRVDDPATGAVTLIGPSGKAQVRDFWLTTNCAGSMLTGESLSDQEVVTPGATPAAPDTGEDTTTTTEDERTLAMDLAGTFGNDLGAQEFDLAISPVNTGTGEVTTGPAVDVDLDLFGIEWASPNGPLYALGNLDDTGDAVFIIDPATGAETHVADITIGQLASVENLGMALTCTTEAPIVVTFTG